MRFLSLFSGIEAASHAWHKLGWQCAGFAEIDTFPKKALAYRYPDVPNLGDVTKITEEQIAALGHLDVLIFGSPCQDLSLAGKRKGLAGERSGLFHDAMRIVGYARKHCGLRFAIWENVFGAFSSNCGEDFAVVVATMAGVADPLAIIPAEGRDAKGNIRWGNEGAIVGEEAMVEWSTLDAQWFGVAQRRRRVFALADFGDWTNRPPILLERDCLRGDSAPSRGAREAVAGILTRSANSGSACGGDGREGLLQPVDVAQCLTTGTGKRYDPFTETLIAFNHNAQPFQMTFDPHTSASLTCSQGSAIAFQSSQSGVRIGDVHATLDACNGSRRYNGAVVNMQVRRLTPRECERLQGFEDDWTLIPGAKDGPRYKALGNSMATPVILWIGSSIERATHPFWQGYRAGAEQ